MNIFKKLFCKQNNPVNYIGCVEYCSFYDKCKKERFVVTKESQDTINSKYTFEEENHGF